MRDLLTFCKSKDPRWILFQKQDFEAKELKRKEAEAVIQAKKQEQQEKYRKYREEMDEYRRKQKEEDAEAEYEEVVVDEFACAACKKVYKKEN